jgi:hypothetical protein
MEDTAEAYDRETLVTLEAITGALVGREATLQSQQPLVEGGLGLRSALAHLGAARLASVNANRVITEVVLTATQLITLFHSDPEEGLAEHGPGPIRRGDHGIQQAESNLGRGGCL